MFENRKFESPKKEFRELAPEKFWGGSIEINDIPLEEFSKIIKEAADEQGFTYSGYRIDKPNGNFEYHFSRYPRRAFGPVAPIETYQTALNTLAEKLGAKAHEETLTEEPKFRVLLGLQEGYAAYKVENIRKMIENGEDLEMVKQQLRKEISNIEEFGIRLDEISTTEELSRILDETDFTKEHSVEEVSSILGEEFQITPAEIQSVGPWGEYREPAVVIEGDKKGLDKVYKLAEDFHQARIAVEDLQEGKSWMVETKYCEDPDKE